MKFTKKKIAFLLAFVLIFAIFPVQTFASQTQLYSVFSPTTHNNQVDSAIEILEDKYNIDIIYPTYNSGFYKISAIYPETLETLENTLSYLSESSIKELSDYYKNEYGTKLIVEYKFKDLDATNSEDKLVTASFAPEKSLLEIYIPKPDSNSSLTGDSPMNILHELAHAVHIMYNNTNNEKSFEQNWIALNGEYKYDDDNLSNNPNINVFASGYAASDYLEDFAETFTVVFISNRDGLGLDKRLIQNNKLTPLGTKIEMVNDVLLACFGDDKIIQDNLHSAFSTPRILNYKGISLSGLYLQYIDMPEARYFPLGILNKFSDLSVNEYVWIKNVGGWTSKSPSKYADNKYILVFPDATWGKTSINIAA